MYDIPIPPEPDDRSVVLDRDSGAWQRQGDRWVRAGATFGLGPSSVLKEWRHLIVDRGPLCPMVAESALEDEGAAPAPMTDADRDRELEARGQGYDLRPLDARVDTLKAANIADLAFAGEVARARRRPAQDRPQA